MKNFKEIFDSNLSTSKLSFLYFKYYSDVSDEEKEAFKSIYSKAYNIAEERECNDALKGVLR